MKFGFLPCRCPYCHGDPADVAEMPSGPPRFTPAPPAAVNPAPWFVPAMAPPPPESRLVNVGDLATAVAYLATVIEGVTPDKRPAAGFTAYYRAAMTSGLPL